MDLKYQQQLVLADFANLERRLEEDKSINLHLEWIGNVLFVRMFGQAGEVEPYLVKIEPWLYPVGPWRVGFIDPSAEGQRCLTIPDRDPRFWPYSQLPGAFGGFHVHYPREHRVFVCRPYTTEFFRYHGDQPWEPGVFNLYRVVMDLDQNIKKASHFSVWREMNYGAGR